MTTDRTALPVGILLMSFGRLRQPRASRLISPAFEAGARIEMFNVMPEFIRALADAVYRELGAAWPSKTRFQSSVSTK